MRTVKTIILLFVLTISQNTYAQNEQSAINKIETQIKQAASQGDYEKAADLTKQKNILIEIQKAVQAGDYEKASELKSQLPKDNTAEINRLKAEQKQAAAKGDYEKAAAIGVEIENIKNGTNNSAQSSSGTDSNSESRQRAPEQSQNSQRERQPSNDQQQSQTSNNKKPLEFAFNGGFTLGDLYYNVSHQDANSSNSAQGFTSLLGLRLGGELFKPLNNRFDLNVGANFLQSRCKSKYDNPALKPYTYHFWYLGFNVNARFAIIPDMLYASAGTFLDIGLYGSAKQEDATESINLYKPLPGQTDPPTRRMCVGLTTRVGYKFPQSFMTLKEVYLDYRRGLNDLEYDLTNTQSTKSGIFSIGIIFNKK